MPSSALARSRSSCGDRLRKRLVQPAPPLGPVAVDPPEGGARTGDAQGDVAAAERQRGPDLVVFLREPDEPRFLVCPIELRLGASDERRHPVGMPVSELVSLTRGLEPLGRELPDRLEHPVAIARELDETLLDQRLERVEVGAGDRLGRLQTEPSSEDTEPSEQHPLDRGQELVRPLDRGPERPLTRVAVAASLEQVETFSDPLEDPCRGQGGRACRRQLDGQRQVVEPGAQRGDIRAGLQVGTRAEQRDAVVSRQWRDPIADLALDAKELAAGHDQGQVRTCCQQPGEVRRDVDDLLEVVQDEDRVTIRDVVGQRALGADRPSDRFDHQRRVPDRREPDPEHPRSVTGDETTRQLDRQARLA